MTRFDLVTVAAVAVAAVLSAAASFALLITVVPAGVAPSAIEDPRAASAGRPSGDAAGDVLVVDIEGGVNEPGIHQLPVGSRLADALVAAGGYADTADLAAAEQSLNLAAELVDGQQILVPVIGAAPAGGGSAAGGLVNLNRATQAELEELPGIGPVTAEKILAARDEQPFATVDDLVTREVLTERQLEQITDLVTVP